MKIGHGGTAYYHLPGLFEFYELYRLFLPLFREHREYFYDWYEIGSIYGAPADCICCGKNIFLTGSAMLSVHCLKKAAGCAMV